MPSQAQAAPNPLLVRLKHRSGPVARWPGVAGAALLGAGLWSSYGYAVSHTGATLAALVAIGMGLSSVLSLVLFLPMLAANLVAGYRRSPEYEQVCATPLPDAALVQACLGAVLYRARALILLALIMLPLATFILLPWFSVLPTTSNANSPWANGGDIGRGLYLAVLLELGFYGLLRWVVSLGVVVALWTRGVVMAGLAALLVPVPLWWAAAATLNRLTPVTALGWALVWPALLAAAPYGLAWLTERWGRRWARHGLDRPS